jgi:integrase
MIYKRGKVYWYKFMADGQYIRESTGQGNDKKARTMESKHRSRLADEKAEREKACERLGCSEVLRCHECEKLFNGQKAIKEGEAIFCSNACCAAWGKKHTRTPRLSEFLGQDFLPFIESQFRASKPKTADYYKYGVSLLLASELGDIKLDEVTSQNGGAFIARNSGLSASTQNCGLRTLRRALNLAYEWGKLDRPTKIRMARGERQRERIVTDAEFLAYRDLCREPWRDVATLIFGIGIRPGEAYKLRWEQVGLNSEGGAIRIADGKSKAARRQIPIGFVPEVLSALKSRWDSQNCPAEGWVFPSGSASGHVEESATKIQHADALKKLAKAKKAFDDWHKDGGNGLWQDAVQSATGQSSDYVARHADAIRAGVKRFEPYCLRHSALTRLAEAGCDAFTLARIAGHSSITITQRYCHPQADAIQRAFKKMAGGHNNGHTGISRLPQQIQEGDVTDSDEKG